MTTFETPIELGKEYKDSMTGFVGVATAICFYPDYTSIRIQACGDSDLKSYWFDLGRLDAVTV